MNKSLLLSFSFAQLLLINITARAQVWSDVNGGTSLGSTFSVYSDGVDDLLYVGGTFDTVGPNYYPSRGFATWNGTTWNDLSGTFGNDFTQCITRYNGQIYHGVKTGSVYVGEQTLDNRVAQFNDHVFTLAVYNGKLFAGGSFSAFDTSTTPYNHIAKWDGTHWTDVGGGMKSKRDNHDDGVYTLYVFGGKLYAGGIFDSAGSIACNNLAVWDGSQWDSVSTGVAQSITNRPKVACLTSYNGELLVGGAFNSAGGVPVNNLAQWDGSSWSSTNAPLDDEVDALCEYNNHLYAGGFFGFNDSVKNHIARWDGNNWTAVGGGVTDGQVVRCMTVWNGMLIIGGKFDELEDTIQVNNLASWTELPPNHHYLPLEEDNFIVTPGIISGPSIIHIVGTSVMRQVEVVDKFGRCRMIKEFSNNSLNTPIELNAQGWDPGVYFVRICTAAGMISKKIVVF